MLWGLEGLETEIAATKYTFEQTTIPPRLGSFLVFSSRESAAVTSPGKVDGQGALGAGQVEE